MSCLLRCKAQIDLRLTNLLRSARKRDEASALCLADNVLTANHSAPLPKTCGLCALLIVAKGGIGL